MLQEQIFARKLRILIVKSGTGIKYKFEIFYMICKSAIQIMKKNGGRIVNVLQLLEEVKVL